MTSAPPGRTSPPPSTSPAARFYTDDVALRTPSLLHAFPVQAPHTHALVTRLDPKPAYDVPGVVRVLTADDVPGANDSGTKHDEPLFPTEVMFHGQAVAWVLGETLEAARTGAVAVEVDYEPLPALVTVREAIEAGSFQGMQPRMERGDVAAGLAAATWVFEGELEMAGQEHFYLETHASLARLDDDGQVQVLSSTQHPTETQEIVAHVLGLPSHQVTVECVRMGGGFGGKEMQPHGYAAVAALGATVTGRPVRVRLTRQQDMTMSGKRHGFHASWRVGFDDDGRLQALDATLTSDGGWSLDLSEPVLSRALCHVDNAYWIPHVRLHGRIARTHKTSQTAFRGFGGPQGMLVIEDVLGRCAPRLGIDPTELRRRNFYADGQATPYGQPVRHPERLVTAWEQVLASGDVAGRRREIAAANAADPHRKRGLAVTPVKFGISFNFTAFNQAGALVHVYKDGSVLINHGGTEMGQGLHTKMLQVAATALGLPIERVRLAPTRTDKVPNTSATAASSAADLNGAAVKDACDQVLARLRPVRDRLGPDASWDEVVSAAYFDRVQLWAAGFYRTEGLSWDAAAMRGEPFKYFAYGVAAAEVEVDGFTGAYQVRRVDIVHDVGDSLSPLVDLGQVEGGFVQGVGWLTLEDLRWDASDGPARGRLATQAASTYKLPSISEMPADLRVSLLERATEEGGRLRVEGGRRAAAHARLLGARGDPRRGRGVRAGLDGGRAAVARHSGGRVVGDRTGAGRVMDWLAALQECRRRREAAVLVTVTEVRGHAPRDAGAKLVVTAGATWGSVGGGNLEETAVRRARALIGDGAGAPVVERFALSDRAPAEHGVQCCGGEVTLLLEPVPVRRAVAVFGMGHVGLEIALLLSRHELELHLVDSRADQLGDERLGPVRSGAAEVHVHRVPVLPELVVAELPAGTDVLVLTHDHAEDLALLDALLRSTLPGSIGLIGSSAKWTRFRARLADLGHPEPVVARVRTPIGDPAVTGVHGKTPAAIALSVVTELLARPAAVPR
ncbi:xanthine dehydrogenase accessory protein XdhC [Nocardioides sp. TF02-7]|uniref:xanthine dehydrogenase accessory protein XdhC n=1 Tax=Nocardioides sp. TF02-7 TaxID=2917724 RepID=UPI001F06553E|nr:xanthine dehydrogenase accessory protein XdhC [Nocardioides sp. TF02-7]UMG91460.1 xanthine dehydrogenase accessory protein XdhC [Nocardioides sp. TF02-7]